MVLVYSKVFSKVSTCKLLTQQSSRNTMKKNSCLNCNAELIKSVKSS